MAAGAEYAALGIRRGEQAIIGVLGLQCARKARCRPRCPAALTGVSCDKREQQLASAFAQFADLLAELLGDLHDLLPDVGLARFAQLVFVVGLDDDRRKNSDQHQDE